jgi:hypothetical protein
MLLLAGAWGLACAFTAALTSSEQTSLHAITQIPAGDSPHATVTVGHGPANASRQAGGGSEGVKTSR